MNYKLNIFFLVILLYTDSAYSGYSKTGIIETLREDGSMTVIFDKIPDKELYYIFSDEKIIGNISSINKIPGVNGKNRYICKYFIFNQESAKILRPGLDIVINDSDKEIDKRLKNNTYIDETKYRTEIVTLVDKRKMVFIPAGKFLMGCSNCDEDEYPEHIEFLGDYYIDKFEVSNNDYKKYSDIKGLAYPEEWKDQLDNRNNFKSAYFSSLPVLVTYYQAVDYAGWAGKRLPVESEWEKASRRPISMDTAGKAEVQSRGNDFKEGIINTEELWLSDKTGENLKKTIAEKYGISIIEKGYLPVDIFEKDSLSYYGAANLDGNALEWTDSWYQPYPGNTKNSKKYGNQYKVIRGGAYFLSKIDSRVTDRKTGGMPDLYKDRIAGFRCVKNIAESDKN